MVAKVQKKRETDFSRWGGGGVHDTVGMCSQHVASVAFLVHYVQLFPSSHTLVYIYCHKKPKICNLSALICSKSQ